MVNTEFIHEFDVLLNAHQNEFGGEISELILDEYEKSVFLTQAQEEFVVAAYNGKNQYGFMFESDEESRRYLDNLVKTAVLTPATGYTDILALTADSYPFVAPDDLMFITYESVKVTSDDSCMNGKILEVVPIKQDELHNVYDNPFRGPNKRRALRLDNTDPVIEVVCKYDIDEYRIRYISRPEPIILVDLDGGLTIQGQYQENSCKLEPVTHRLILQRAVSLALSSKAINQRNNKQTIKNNQQTSN